MFDFLDFPVSQYVKQLFIQGKQKRREYIMGTPILRTLVDKNEVNILTDVISFAVNSQTIGLVPKLVGGFFLKTGSYGIASAQIGCSNATNTASLFLQKPDGTVLATVGAVPGGLAWRNAAASFTLAADTYVDLVLSCNDVSDTAFILGFKL